MDDDFVYVNLAKAKDFVDEPLVDDQLRDFGLVRDGFSQAGFSLHPPTRHSLSPAVPAFPAV